MTRANSAFEDKVCGMLLGFAIGDALGAPAAGIRRCDYIDSRGPIGGFQRNAAHPLLGHLASGQYTENTRLLLDTACDMIVTERYSKDRRIETLGRWADQVHSDPYGGRWPGPTTLAGASSLKSAAHIAPASESVGSSYRIPPLAAALSTESELKDHIRAETLLTHDGREPLAGGTLLGILLFRMVRGEQLREVLESATEYVRHHVGDSEVGRQSALIPEISGEDHEGLRLRFGTGARAAESIPLSIAIAIRSAGCFSEAVLAGANSYRPDDVGAPPSCTSYAEELKCVNGGNTDGIAALVGSIVGADIGSSCIPRGWLSVEGADNIFRIGMALSNPR